MDALIDRVAGALTDGLLDYVLVKWVGETLGGEHRLDDFFACLTIFKEECAALVLSEQK